MEIRLFDEEHSLILIVIDQRGRIDFRQKLKTPNKVDQGGINVSRFFKNILKNMHEITKVVFRIQDCLKTYICRRSNIYSNTYLHGVQFYDDPLFI